MRALLLTAVLLLAAAPLARAGAEERLPAIGLDERLENSGTDSPVVVPPALREVPLARRISVTHADLVRGADLDFSALDRRVSSMPPAHRIWLHLTAMPPADAPADLAAWRRFLRSLVAHLGGRLQAVELPLAAGDGPRDAKLAAFLLKLSAVQVRAAAPDVLVVLHGARAGDTAWLESLYALGVAPYVDAVSLPAGSADRQFDHLRAVLDRLDPGTRVIEVSRPLGAPAEAASMLVRTTLTRLGSNVAATTFTGTPDAVVAALGAAASLADLLRGELVALDPAAAGLTIAPDDRRGAGALSVSRLLYDVATFSTYLVYWSESASGELDVAVTLSGGSSPMVRAPIGGRVERPVSSAHDPGTERARARVPFDRSPRILDFNYGAAPVRALRDETRAERTLGVDEIVARHQQVQMAQDDLLESFIADVRMQQHFRPTAADPGYDVATEARYYVSRDGTEWEELSFSVNGTRWGPDRPAFPLLQAEKVLSLPLDLRLTADYRYRLDRIDTEEGRRCYVVSFEPASGGRSLYRGTVWIDAERFVRLRLQTVQTELSAPIVSNEEVHRFEPVHGPGGHEFWLPARIDSRQILLIAGRNLLVEKDAVFSSFSVNGSDFLDRRQAARASDRIMFKETDEGLRYFVKEQGTRRVSDRMTTRARAVAMGVTVDPSYDFPLPIAGLNYLDFEFLGNKDTQLAVLFGGVLVLGNVQRGRLFGSALDGSLDLFAIAVPGNDRVYAESGEREGERLLTWPLSFGANVGWQATEFQKLTASYQFRFDGYVADRTTADDFVVPASTVTNGLGAGYEFRRAGYSLTAAASWHDRIGWRGWGPSTALVSGGGSYTKYNASLSKDFYVRVFHKIHLNAAYFGGRDLDRFTSYQFGLFDETRMHGVPASGIRFAELGMLRGGYSFNLFDEYRLDLFLEHAAGRQSRSSDPLEHITGLGAAVSLRAPWRTIVRADIGKSFLPDALKDTGSTVLQIMVLKPL